VDVSGLDPDEEQELFDGLNRALEAAGFTVTGLDGFPIDLEAVTIMHNSDPLLEDGIIDETTSLINASYEAHEAEMVLADGASHTVYLISPFTGVPSASPCASVYSPDDGFIVGFRCVYAGYVFELKNVPPETAEEHIAQTKRDYSPSGTTSQDFLGTFFLKPPFFGLLLVAAVAILVAALLVRRRRKPTVALPPMMPPQPPPPGPP
jgi:hypothetical protein